MQARLGLSLLIYLHATHTRQEEHFTQKRNSTHALPHTRPRPRMQPQTRLPTHAPRPAQHARLPLPADHRHHRRAGRRHRVHPRHGAALQHRRQAGRARLYNGDVLQHAGQDGPRAVRASPGHEVEQAANRLEHLSAVQHPRRDRDHAGGVGPCGDAGRLLRLDIDGDADVVRLGYVEKGGEVAREGGEGERRGIGKGEGYTK